MTVHKGYSVQTFRFSSGETVPMLLRDGMPMFYPSVWTSTVSRMRGASTRSMEANLHGLLVLYTWANQNRHDLDARLLSGDYLRDWEIGSLCDNCWRRHQDGEVLEQTVSIHTYTARTAAIAEYLDWLLIKGAETLASSDPALSSFATKQAWMRESFGRRKPNGKCAV